MGNAVTSNISLDHEGDESNSEFSKDFLPRALVSPRHHRSQTLSNTNYAL
jgi:hypothetical protein